MSIFSPDSKIFTLVFRTFSVASVLLIAPAAVAGGKGHAAHQHGVAAVNIVGEEVHSQFSSKHLPRVFMDSSMKLKKQQT